MANDTQTLLTHFTDAGVYATFGYPRGRVLQLFPDGLGLAPFGEPTRIEAPRKKGRVWIDLRPGDSVATESLLTFVNLEGDWKVDDRVLVPEILGDTVPVKVELSEFAFTFNQSETAAGDFAFELNNSGDQVHQLAVIRVPAGQDLTSLLSKRKREELEEVGTLSPIHPGERAQMRFKGRLPTGRYALVCFLPNTDPKLAEVGAPHSSLGMVREFTLR